MRLTTDTQLAEQWGIDVAQLHALRKRHRWPCVKLGRFDVRFTDEQIEAIVAQHTQAPEVDASPSVKIAGQTSRSAKRRRAG